MDNLSNMKFSETLPHIEPSKFNDWQAMVQKIIKTEDTSILNKRYVNEDLTTNFIYFKDNELKDVFKNISQGIFDSYSANSNHRENYKENRKNELFTAIYCNEYSEKGLNQVSEVTIALKEFIEKLETGVKQNYLFEVVLREDFYLNIAKLRTLRYMICKLLAEFNSESNFIIVAESSNYNKSYKQEHNNLIRITTEALSGYLGAADFIEPGNYDRSNLVEESLSNTISQNVNRILEFESIINSSTDATNGSYFIDKLTLDFINKVVSNLENKEDLNTLVPMNKSVDERSLFNLKKTIVGVNKYEINTLYNPLNIYNNNDLTSFFENIQSLNSKTKHTIYFAFLCNPESISDEVKFYEKLFKILSFKVEIGSFLESIEDLQNVIEFNNFENVLIFTDATNQEREIKELIQSLQNRKITLLNTVNKITNLSENVINLDKSNLVEAMQSMFEEMNKSEAI